MWMSDRNLSKLCSLALVLGACSFSGASTGDGDGDGDGDADAGPDFTPLEVSGTIVDLVTREPVTGATVVGVDLSDGEISIDGANFVISGVVPQSIFRLQTSANGYETTISDLVAVENESVSGVEIEVLSQPFLDSVYAQANVAPSAGVVVARLVDGMSGAAAEGVVKNAFSEGEEVVFLSSVRAPDAMLPASTSSGIAFLLNVNPGLVTLSSALLEQHFFIAPAARVRADTVSLVSVEVGTEEPEIPTGIFFNPDIMDLMDRRGCENCHSGSGPGKANYSLDGAGRYDETVARINIDTPLDSLLLSKPRFEDPFDGHQVVFANQFDPDHLMIQGWITDGTPEQQ